MDRVETTGEHPRAVAHDEVVWKYKIYRYNLSKALQEEWIELKTDRDVDWRRARVENGGEGGTKLTAVLARVSVYPGGSDDMLKMLKDDL